MLRLEPSLCTFIQRRAARPGATALSAALMPSSMVKTWPPSLPFHLDGGASDGLAVSINVDRPIGRAHQHGNRTAGAALRGPLEFAARERFKHLRREILRRQEHAGVRGEVRLRLDIIADHHRSAASGDPEKQSGKIIRHPNAAMAGRISGRLPECIAMPLHVNRCMFGIGALLYFFERCVCFFSRMVKTPVGRLRPLVPS